jgi:hypothetical protein
MSTYKDSNNKSLGAFQALTCEERAVERAFRVGTARANSAPARKRGAQEREAM